MAQKTTIVLTSDLTDEEMAEGEGQTVEFGLDGVTYETDLFNDQADELRRALAPYIENARRVGGRKQQAKPARTHGTGAASVDREQNQAIREWARKQGMEVSERGRIPGKVAEAYHQSAA